MLRQLFPNARFARPATESAMTTAEAALGVRLPEQLRRLYADCDGFREDRGNAKYLLSLVDEDFIGSLVAVTRSIWTDAAPDLKPFIFFGSSGADEWWGIDPLGPRRIIAYHHTMGDGYDVVGSDIIEVWRADYARYDEVEGNC